MATLTRTICNTMVFCHVKCCTVHQDFFWMTYILEIYAYHFKGCFVIFFVKGYMEPTKLQAGIDITTDDIRALFGNIEEIFSFNR